jgi:transposase-like protein
VELIRRVGISEQTFYRWKKQYVDWLTGTDSASWGNLAQRTYSPSFSSIVFAFAPVFRALGDTG